MKSIDSRSENLLILYQRRGGRRCEEGRATFGGCLCVTFNEKYYRDFAQFDNDQYAQKNGYSYSTAVARVYNDHCKQGDLPVTDIGCDTDFVASALGLAPTVYWWHLYF